MPFNPKDSRDSLQQAGGQTHDFEGSEPLEACKHVGCGLNVYAAVHGQSWRRFGKALDPTRTLGRMPDEEIETSIEESLDL